jgi:hypothetical protein
MTEIVCLANSRKHNNKCVAGLNLKTGQWIRPITNTEDSLEVSMDSTNLELESDIQDTVGH